MKTVTITAAALQLWSLLLVVAVAPAAAGYRPVRTSGPLPVTVHVRAGGVAASTNRTSTVGGVVFPAPMQASTTTPAPASAANAAAAAAAGFTSFSTSSSASNYTGAPRNQTRSERLRAR